METALILLNGCHLGQLGQIALDLRPQHFQSPKCVASAPRRAEPGSERRRLDSLREGREGEVDLGLGQHARGCGGEQSRWEGVGHGEGVRLLASQQLKEPQPEVPGGWIVAHLAASHPELDYVKVVRVGLQREAIPSQ